jgi:hypothetical protein
LRLKYEEESLALRAFVSHFDNRFVALPQPSMASSTPIKPSPSRRKRSFSLSGDSPSVLKMRSQPMLLEQTPDPDFGEFSFGLEFPPGKAKTGVASPPRRAMDKENVMA